MRYSHLSQDQLLHGIGESHMVIANLVKYQEYLSTGSGLPKDEVARAELMVSNVKMVAKIKEDLVELEKALEAKGTR
jgi:hypothetical protein